MGDAAFVVTSTNNRAVDNVVDPLNAAERRRAAARAARRQPAGVRAAAGAAARARRAWLERARARPATERALELAAARDRFKHVRSQVDALLAPRSRFFAAAGAPRTAARELAQLHGGTSANAQ